jgi:hypothetical protein
VKLSIALEKRSSSSSSLVLETNRVKVKRSFRFECCLLNVKCSSCDDAREKVSQSADVSADKAN